MALLTDQQDATVKQLVDSALFVVELIQDNPHLKIEIQERLEQLFEEEATPREVRAVQELIANC